MTGTKTGKAIRKRFVVVVFTSHDVITDCHGTFRTNTFSGLAGRFVVYKYSYCTQYEFWYQKESGLWFYRKDEKSKWVTSMFGPGKTPVLWTKKNHRVLIKHHDPDTFNYCIIDKNHKCEEDKIEIKQPEILKINPQSKNKCTLKNCRMPKIKPVYKIKK